MLTYQDLLKIGDGDGERAEFVLKVMREHRASEKYGMAEIADKYYRGQNVTIESVIKVLYDDEGNPHVDKLTPNHKVPTLLFRKCVDQKTEYLVGNGVSFGEQTDEIKAKLGESFDDVLSDVLTEAYKSGAGYALYNHNNTVFFDFRSCAVLKDVTDGAIKAAVRSWRLADNTQENLTLYELDGFTVYVSDENGIRVAEPKRPYKLIVRRDGIREEIIEGENYTGFPIIPLTLNPDEESELVGLRETIDAIDAVSSGMVNTVERVGTVYWTVTGAGGMDDMDDAALRDHLKTVGVVHIDGGQEIQSHVINPPVDGSQVTRDMLVKKFYEDAALFDSSVIATGNQTATAIWAAYSDANISAGKAEKQVRKFIARLLRVAGIPYTAPTFNYDRIINRGEEIQALISAGNYLSGEFVTGEILNILGKQDLKEEVLQQMDADALSRLGGAVDDDGGDDDGANRNGPADAG